MLEILLQAARQAAARNRPWEFLQGIACSRSYGHACVDFESVINVPKRTVTVFQTNASLRIYELIKSMGLVVVQLKCVDSGGEV